MAEPPAACRPGAPTARRRPPEASGQHPGPAAGLEGAQAAGITPGELAARSDMCPKWAPLSPKLLARWLETAGLAERRGGVLYPTPLSVELAAGLDWTNRDQAAGGIPAPATERDCTMRAMSEAAPRRWPPRPAS